MIFSEPCQEDGVPLAVCLRWKWLKMVKTFQWIVAVVPLLTSKTPRKKPGEVSRNLDVSHPRWMKKVPLVPWLKPGTWKPYRQTSGMNTKVEGRAEDHEIVDLLSDVYLINNYTMRKREIWIGITYIYIYMYQSPDSKTLAGSFLLSHWADRSCPCWEFHLHFCQVFSSLWRFRLIAQIFGIDALWWMLWTVQVHGCCGRICWAAFCWNQMTRDFTRRHETTRYSRQASTFFEVP